MARGSNGSGKTPRRGSAKVNGQRSAKNNEKLTNEELCQFSELVGNVMASRQEFFSNFFDPRRDIDDECGYPSSANGYIEPQQYQNLYEREPVAARVVEIFPHECWQVQPEVYEDESVTTETAFEVAFKEVAKSINPVFSYYQGNSGSAIWEYLRRADVLSGIGHYGALLLGVSDGKPLSEPVDGMPKSTSIYSTGVSVLDQGPSQYFSFNEPGPTPPRRNLLYMRAFPESMCQISQWESDPSSVRYGLPNKYTITLFDPRDTTTGVGVPNSTIDVHWHRIIHLADNLASSETFGVPRMRTPLNRLLDLRKLYAGAAEMYWKGAFPGLSIETYPQLGGDANLDREATEDMMERYMNGLQRYLALIGMSAKSLAPQVVDPTPQIMAALSAVCIKIGVPMRKFMGTERGDMASANTQDDADWNDRIRERQMNYVTPRIVVPLIDRFIALGILPRPSRFTVWWPDRKSQTDQEKARVAFQRTQALAQYLTSRAVEMMRPEDFLVRFLGFADTEAVEIVEAARTNPFKMSMSTSSTKIISPDSTASSGADSAGVSNE